MLYQKPRFSVSKFPARLKLVLLPILPTLIFLVDRRNELEYNYHTLSPVYTFNQYRKQYLVLLRTICLILYHCKLSFQQSVATSLETGFPASIRDGKPVYTSLLPFMLFCNSLSKTKGGF